MLSLCLISCEKKIDGCTDSNANNYNAEANQNCCCDYMITYDMAGNSNSYNITYENSSGGTSQVTGVTNFWEESFVAKPGAFLYLSAQNLNAFGSVTVRIWKGNEIFKSSTSDGAYVIATASGTL